MVQPRLIHPLDITFIGMDRGATIYDEDTREPIQQATRKEPVVLPGQLFYSMAMTLRATNVGVLPGERGYVLFLTRDLADYGVVLDEAGNDEIVQAGDRVLNGYTTRLEWMGTYTDQGGFTMVKAYFKDRLPSKPVR